MTNAPPSAGEPSELPGPSVPRLTSVLITLLLNTHRTHWNCGAQKPSAPGSAGEARLILYARRITVRYSRLQILPRADGYDFATLPARSGPDRFPRARVCWTDPRQRGSCNARVSALAPCPRISSTQQAPAGVTPAGHCHRTLRPAVGGSAAWWLLHRHRGHEPGTSALGVKEQRPRAGAGSNRRSTSSSAGPGVAHRVPEPVAYRACCVLPVVAFRVLRNCRRWLDDDRAAGDAGLVGRRADWSRGWAQSSTRYDGGAAR